MKKPVDENVLIRRMRIGRLRQSCIAVLSVLVAGIGICVLSPVMVGGFAFYAITGLLILNAFFALRQTRLIIRPIETMLRRMQGIESAVDSNNYSVEHLYNNADDEFACLAAGMDHLIEKLVEKTRVANERCLHHVAVVQATPFTFFTVSSTGKVFTIVKDYYNLVPFLKLAPGKMPTAREWGATNFATYQQSVKKAFNGQDTFWFDMPFPATKDQPEHNLRATVARINDLSALVVMGDMPTIDRLVDSMTADSERTSRQQKHAALKRFAASVAHDGRNIFTSLSNLVAANKQSTDPHVRERTAIAEDAIRRGTNLMSEMMQLAGETKYALQCMPTNESCRKLYDNPTLRTLIPENITLITDVSDEPMPDIDIDPNQAWKVSFNLVKNSVEAIGHSVGRIWLTAKPYVMTPEVAKTFRCSGPMPTGPGVMTSESDDGPGVNPDIIDKIFDPYASSKGEGRGLGLATVYSVVEAHNGAIRVTSKPGMGTVFEIFLPASRHASDELEMVKAVSPNGEILLVDDDPAILQTTSLVLRTIKIAAHPASNVDDAVRKMRTLRSRIRAIVVDAHLAGANRLLRTVREDQPGMTVVLTSGTPESSLGNLIAPNLYDRFLGKPYSVAELSKVLNDVKS